MMVYGGVDPLSLKFDCSRCKPQVTITLLEVHPEHLPKRLMIQKPMKVGGKIAWHTKRFRGRKTLADIIWPGSRPIVLHIRSSFRRPVARAQSPSETDIRAKIALGLA
ncbi:MULTISPECIES: hypothetical protein [unclassified Mesorhizobium]|uniref:hypothetical protein n=1 Tax=unclassified Mesorhizobium TaxID=325217 RepID=UPI001CCD2D95|nr:MULTISPECIES: hypothetical protein [unclassified Mesorhizobium]MBZ9701579.1 hypothetical protein [Mesorhizobium sp. CO1-1-3]MBZ9949189.1 hypothetical protein [Mesorhizobium sp. BR1-1-11]